MLNKQIVSFYIFVLFILVFNYSYGKNNKEERVTKIFHVPTTSTPVKIDGVLKEPAWQKALVFELNHEIDPGENLPAKVLTQCLLISDSKMLYVAFRAYDSKPSAIRAHYMDRDTAWDDDWVFITLDPFHDNRRGFEFIVNPLGVQMDSLLNEVGGEGAEVDNTWDAIWDASGKLTTNGYTVEMAIPFTSLRFPRQKGDQIWGFQAMRHYPRNFNYFFRLTPWDRNRGCTLCENVALSGFSSASHGGNLEFNPAVTAHRTDNKDPFPEGNLRENKIITEPGLSTRWSITPNVILNTAINPDFSQVEADVAQLDINTRFALYYPEKRPFFLEGADLFKTPFNAVYSRTIADPIWGLKLSGKEHRNAFGVLVARDDLTNLLLPANQKSQLVSLEQRVLNTIVRFRRDIGKQSTLGLLVTNRQGDNYYNTVFGGDGYLKMTAVDSIGFQILFSRSSYPNTISREHDQPQDSFIGWSIHADYKHEARNWHWWVSHEYLERDFRADSGFIPRVDTRATAAGIRRVFWSKRKQGGWFSRINLSLEGNRIQDQDGNLTDQLISFHSEINGPKQSILSLGVVTAKELYNDTLFDQKSVELQFSIYPSSQLFLTLGGKFGDSIDYIGNRPGNISRINSGIHYFLGRHLQCGLDHSLEYLYVNDRERLYKANLFQLKLVYQFNIRTFIRTIVQYLDINRNLQLYLVEPDPIERHLFLQLLFSFKINPQTLFFLGYSDNSYGLNGINLSKKDRTFFVKMSYAWQL